jgi:hypothetical protein
MQLYDPDSEDEEPTPTTQKCTPESLLEYVQGFQKTFGRHPTLSECKEEFGGGILRVLVAGWELQRRGLL